MISPAAWAEIEAQEILDRAEIVPIKSARKKAKSLLEDARYERRRDEVSREFENRHRMLAENETNHLI